MNDLQSITDTLQLSLESRINDLSSSTSDSLIIDWTTTPKKKKPHRKGNLSRFFLVRLNFKVQNNINPNVIKTSKGPPQTLHQTALKNKRK